MDTNLTINMEYLNKLDIKKFILISCIFKSFPFIVKLNQKVIFKKKSMVLYFKRKLK